MILGYVIRLEMISPLIMFTYPAKETIPMAKRRILNKFVNILCLIANQNSLTESVDMYVWIFIYCTVLKRLDERSRLAYVNFHISTVWSLYDRACSINFFLLSMGF